MSVPMTLSDLKRQGVRGHFSGESPYLHSNDLTGMTEFGILTHVGSSIFLKGKGKASSLDIAPLFLQS